MKRCTRNVYFFLQIADMPHRTLATETYYHIYNRGWNKQTLFYKYSDYEKFYANIDKYLEKYLNVKIFAYCFLPNHFHFLLGETKSPGSIEPGLSSELSKFVGQVQQAYAMYFNARYQQTAKEGRKAPVFEGRFKAKVINSDEYLSEVQTYIEHNAVKHELVDRAEDWSWSSLRARALISPYFE